LFFTVSGKLIARIAAEDIAQDLVTNIAFPDLADFEINIIILGDTVTNYEKSYFDREKFLWIG
jgi:hypothetical protein